MTDTVEVAVVGAGQAGLSVSHELSAAGVEHLVLDRGRVGETWRGRWDSFCLVIPNWTVQLAGAPYDGDDPDGFMPRDDVVRHLERYAGSFGAPVREGVAVRSLERDGDGFRLRTAAGDDLLARQVVVATGGYQRPHRPPAAAGLPPAVPVLDADSYRNPQALPPGRVLVVGSGQTGCQLAEELAEAGREVFLACGRAPWLPRRIEGRDVLVWVRETPFLEQTLADLPHPAARLAANPQTSGGRGGHDLHYRTLDALGVRLLGRFVAVDDGVARFAPDLAESVAWADARYNELRDMIERTCRAAGRPVPEMPVPTPFSCDPPETLRLGDLGAVVLTSGFRPDYASWMAFPDAFDGMGFPLQADGSSTVVPGLHFMGVHFQRKRKSATLLGVGEDARVLAPAILAGRRRPLPG